MLLMFHLGNHHRLHLVRALLFTNLHSINLPKDLIHSLEGDAFGLGQNEDDRNLKHCSVKDIHGTKQHRQALTKSSTFSPNNSQ